MLKLACLCRPRGFCVGRRAGALGAATKQAKRTQSRTARWRVGGCHKASKETQLTIKTCHLQATRENSEHSVKSGLKLLEKVQRSIPRVPQVTRESSEFGIKSMSQAARESSEFSSIKRC